MDSNKQDAIDMLLFNNAFSGELGQKARALLERADIFGKVSIPYSNPHSPFLWSHSDSLNCVYACTM
jgi:hypothetical protein